MFQSNVLSPYMPEIQRVWYPDSGPSVLEDLKSIGYGPQTMDERVWWNKGKNYSVVDVEINEYSQIRKHSTNNLRNSEFISENIFLSGHRFKLKSHLNSKKMNHGGLMASMSVQDRTEIRTKGCINYRRSQNMHSLKPISRGSFVLFQLKVQSF